jgi:mRNA interferase MazF
MKPFRRGQIWLVNFDPSFGHEYQKVRPALIVQNADYIEKSSLVTVLPISSQISKHTVLDVLVEKDKNNRLAKDSLVKIKQISSFDKRRFCKYVGEINTKKMQEITECLRGYLQL